jgi:hypothetical protein
MCKDLLATATIPLALKMVRWHNSERQVMKTYLGHHLGTFVLCFMAPLLGLFLPYKFVERHVSGPWTEVLVLTAMAAGIGIASAAVGSKLDAWRQRKTK